MHVRSCCDPKFSFKEICILAILQCVAVKKKKSIIYNLFLNTKNKWIKGKVSPVCKGKYPQGWLMMQFSETPTTLHEFWPLDKKVIIYIHVCNHISLSWHFYFSLKDPKGQLCIFKASLDWAIFGFITLLETQGCKRI